MDIQITIIHFVILNLFQDLNGLLKQVQNDSEKQNGLDKKKRIRSGFLLFE